VTRTEAAKTALERRTRRPTGKPPWPILLLAGAEKSGKSYSAAQASGSDLVGRTLWIGVGEDDPDEYGNIPGADFEIVEHNGTYRDILAAVDWAAEQTARDGRPALLVLDSASRLWDLICDMAQDDANDRAAKKARKENRPVSGDDAEIAMLEWNVAASRWASVIDALRRHQGPSIVTARLEEVTVLGPGGKPTSEKRMKVKAHKSLPYDVGGIVEMPERGKAYLTGVRTTRMEMPERRIYPGFSVDKLWRDLGLADVEVGPRTHAMVDRTQEPAAGSPQDERTAQAFRAAQAAANAADVDTLAGIGLKATRLDLMDVPVARALTAQWAAVTPGVTPAVVLREWIAACEAHIGRSGDSVAGTAAADDTPPADQPATDGATRQEVPA